MKYIRNGMAAYMNLSADLAPVVAAAGLTAYNPNTPALFQAHDTFPPAYASVAVGPRGKDHLTLRSRPPVRVTHIERLAGGGRVSFNYDV
jgi:hypothetical protein